MEILIWSQVESKSAVNSAVAFFVLDCFVNSIGFQKTKENTFMCVKVNQKLAIFCITCPVPINTLTQYHMDLDDRLTKARLNFPHLNLC